jgi:hypothetical protein
VNKLDKLGMLRTLARLRGSALRGRALGRSIVILAVLMTYSFAAAEEITTPTKEQKPVNDLMNIKLYLHNQINDWYEFECANVLAYKESSWRVDAVNKSSGAYGLFQHMSEHAPKWDAYQQIHKHIEYINHRYDGSWCKALSHLESRGWH